MYKRLTRYRMRIDALLQDPPSDVCWEELLWEHRDQIAFFQHERLVHLLVTLTFALMELACALASIFTASPACAALMLLMLVLLVPYVVHYYHLENGTQALYIQYDQLLVARSNSTHSCGQSSASH